MNKKLLFAAMSLAALTACTNDDFEKQQIVAEESSPIQFEVINDAFTKASMDGNKIKWSATDGDQFTLYHGGAAAKAVTGFENATYTASEEEGKAVLKTPSMIKEGRAIMVWPVDSNFRITPATPNISIKIPAELDNVEKNIPYVSDQFNIAAYNKLAPYNTAGLNRAYPVFMRPMASQINLIADYAGTDATLATLYGGDDPIAEIVPTTVDLLSTEDGSGDNFTTQINLAFATPSGTIATQWATVANNAWESVTGFGAVSGDNFKLTTKVIENKKTCKFLILPQAAALGAGVTDGGIVVNTNYGKVVVANKADADNHKSEYTPGEIADAWYRYVEDPTKPSANIHASENVPAAKETSGEGVGKYKVTSEPKVGMAQTIDVLSTYTATSGVVKGEPVGAAAKRYVKVLLTHLDMSGLHLDTDKELYDAVRVWDKMGLSSVTVYLDGKGTGKQFTMSQKTIEKINAINAAATGGRYFHVQPCNAEEVCNEIVITGGGTIQDLTFIVKNGTKQADVVLQTGFNWKWDGSIKVDGAGNTGIKTIINRGTLENGENNVLNTVLDDGIPYTPTNIKFKNDFSGKWNITAGRIRVQNEVENFGTVTISKGAQYLEDGASFAAAAKFTNNAKTLEKRFNGGSEKIGKVINYGVFATIGGGEIDNYSLIEHKDKDAKTYITHNQKGGNFANNFAANTNMMGRINLPFDNKDEDNISISAVTNFTLMEGFVSVTITADNAPSTSLSVSAVGDFVNSLIVNGGIDEIADLPGQIKYVEVDTDHEIAWNLSATATYAGLTILSDVNIKLGTTVNAAVTYLGAKDGKNADMYVGGNFNKAGTDWDGYYGDTSGNVAEHYITFK